mmetsp:Transcript_2132/g.5390  ORF Transcript_2132/g.5390 Transcript_2132/m.5390 type:complete len:327 (-) Transcript_2132:59-1039(-)
MSGLAARPRMNSEWVILPSLSRSILSNMRLALVSRSMRISLARLSAHVSLFVTTTARSSSFLSLSEGSVGSSQFLLYRCSRVQSPLSPICLEDRSFSSSSSFLSTASTASENHAYFGFSIAGTFSGSPTYSGSTNVRGTAASPEIAENFCVAATARASRAPPLAPLFACAPAVTGMSTWHTGHSVAACRAPRPHERLVWVTAAGGAGVRSETKRPESWRLRLARMRSRWTRICLAEGLSQRSRTTENREANTASGSGLASPSDILRACSSPISAFAPAVRLPHCRVHMSSSPTVTIPQPDAVNDSPPTGPAWPSNVLMRCASARQG